MSFLKTLNDLESRVLASNLYTPNCLLQELVHHRNRLVGCAVAGNPCVSDNIWEQWASFSFDRFRRLKTFTRLELQSFFEWETHLSIGNRLAVLLNPQTPILVLAVISLSSYWLERYAIAINPNTPFTILQRLENDGNRIVRAAAKAKLANIEFTG
ncbi:MAG: hypothetical protein ACRC2R_06180 [Xenococcaceae cyanobacterium]